MTLLCSMLWFLCATNIVLSPTTKPMHGSPARALVNGCDKLRLELARWFTTCFKPAADERLADGRNLSIPARSSVSSSRPLFVQLCRCTTAVILGPRGVKMLPPYDNCISAGHLVFGKNVVIKAGTTVHVCFLECELYGLNELRHGSPRLSRIYMHT